MPNNIVGRTQNGVHFVSVPLHSITCSALGGSSDAIKCVCSGDVQSMHWESLQTKQATAQASRQLHRRRASGQDQATWTCPRKTEADHSVLQSYWSQWNELCTTVDSTKERKIIVGDFNSLEVCAHGSVRFVYAVQEQAAAEGKDNLAEQTRLTGKLLKYGDVIQVQNDVPSFMMSYFYIWFKMSCRSTFCMSTNEPEPVISAATAVHWEVHPRSTRQSEQSRQKLPSGHTINKSHNHQVTQLSSRLEISAHSYMSKL